MYYVIEQLHLPPLVRFQIVLEPHDYPGWAVYSGPHPDLDTASAAIPQTPKRCHVCNGTGQLPWYYDTNKTKDLTCFCEVD